MNAEEQEIEAAVEALGGSFAEVFAFEKLMKSRGTSFGDAMMVIKFKQLQDWLDEWYEVEVRAQISHRRSLVGLLLVQTAILGLILWRVW